VTLNFEFDNILAKCWGIWKVKYVFPTSSNYMIRRAEQLVMDQGMSSPNPKSG
jgi:hypothetical protein